MSSEETTPGSGLFAASGFHSSLCHSARSIAYVACMHISSSAHGQRYAVERARYLVKGGVGHS
jgi:hypothetical protein